MPATLDVPVSKSPAKKGSAAPASIDFYEALRAVADGARVTKREWANPAIYVCLRDEFLRIVKADGTEHDLIVRYADMIGTDWYVLDVN